MAYGFAPLDASCGDALAAEMGSNTVFWMPCAAFRPKLEYGEKPAKTRVQDGIPGGNVQFQGFGGDVEPMGMCSIWGDIQ